MPQIEAYQLLQLMSVGLLQVQKSASKGAPLIPLNATLKQAWEQLCFLCFQAGELPPRSLPELIDWLNRPVCTWAVIGDVLSAPEYQSPLLQNGDPSSLCIQLGSPAMDAYNPRLELEDEHFKRIYQLCKQRGDAGQYSKAREFICRNAILEDYYTVFSANEYGWDDDILHLIKACYEDIPSQFRIKDKSEEYVFLCPVCGWTLRRRRGEVFCHEDGSCAATHGDLTEGACKLAYRPGMSRTLEGIQRYVVAPERELIKLADTLTETWGVSATLYPGIDAYDLLIEFINGQRWAVDMKDHRNAAGLAMALRSFPYSPPWDRAFYVFPDERADSDGYLNQFANFWQPQKDVAFMGVRTFLKCVRQELEK